MKFVGNRPGLVNVELESLDNLSSKINEVVQNIAAEAIVLALEDWESGLEFPIQYSEDPAVSGGRRNGSDGHGGPEVTDPLTLFLVVALENEDGELPYFQINLRDELLGDMHSCADDGSYSYGLGKLADALRNLADEIDASRQGVHPKD